MPHPFVYHGSPMSRLLFRYICAETAVPFALGLTVFTFVLLMGRLLKLAEMVFARGVPFLDVARLILYMLPSFLLVAIPMAFLLAVLLAMGRLSADSEVTAMKASGMSIGTIAVPVIVFGVITYAVTTFVSVYALPWGNTAFKKFLHGVIETRAAMSITEKVFNDEFPGLVIYVDGFDPKSGRISGILIHDERNPDEPSTIFAASGQLATNPEERIVRLRLDNGGIHRGIGTGGYRLVEFTSYDLSIALQQEQKKARLNEEDMTLGELLARTKSPEEQPKLVREMHFELHKRFALPFACVVFAIIAVPLGIQNQRSGRAGGFASGIILLMLYYILMSAGKTVNEKGIAPAFVAVWIPNALFLGLGIFLLKRAALDRAIPLTGYVTTALAWVRHRFERRKT